MKNKKHSFLTLAAFALLTTFVALTATIPALAHSDVDLEYIDLMIAHHRDGIEMARLAETKAETAEVKEFAGRVIADQEKDIAELQTRREQLYPGEEEADGINIKNKRMSAGEMKKIAEADMKKLESAGGKAFDHLFLDTLTRHHKMAIDMSNTQITKGDSAELKKFSRETIAKQNKEIGEMAAMMKKVGGKTKTAKTGKRRS